jgi:hypothetical protein
VDAASCNKTRQNKKLEYSGRLAGKTAGDEIASWRMIASHVQEATGRKLAAAIVFGQANNFLCHWRGKVPDLKKPDLKMPDLAPDLN